MPVTSEFIVNFMLNSVWQIAAIFATAALVSWLLRNGPARYRHTLWIVALSACLVVPLLTASRVVPAWVSSLQVDESPARIETASLSASAPVVAREISEDLNVDHTGPGRRKTVTTSSRTVLFIGLTYALLICGRAIRLIRFWRRKEKLRRSAIYTGLAPQLQAAAQRCRDLLKIGNAQVAVSSEARVPYTIGTFRPLIVLPQSFCTVADESRLLSVIGHEMAHVKRGDFLTNLICELVALPIWFHPLTLLIKRRIDRTRELACDELVTTHVLAPKVYARSLLWAARISSQSSSQAFMLSIFDGKILEERINLFVQEAFRMSVSKCVLLLISFLLLPASMNAQPKAGTLKLKPYTFENDKKGKVEAEFGTLFVPENRSNPQANIIELAFVRFKSTAKNPGLPIVYLAGGPGGSGIGAATGTRFLLFMALREIADVIAFDQRGTGHSKPNLGCFDRLALPLDVAPSREAAIKGLQASSRNCAYFWRDIQRVDLAAYNTNESVDDSRICAKL